MKSLVKLIDPLLTNYILLINQPGTSKHTSIYMFPLRNILLIIYFKTVMILELITLTIKVAAPPRLRAQISLKFFVLVLYNLKTVDRF